MTLSRRSFLKVAGLTVVAAAGASMFTSCSAPVVDIVYATKATDDASKKAVTDLNNDKSCKKFVGASSNKDYIKGYVSSYLKKHKAVLDEKNTAFKPDTEGTNKGKLVIYVTAEAAKTDSSNDTKTE